MNIVKTLEQYDDDSVYFCDPIKNNIMNDGNFIRIIYSTPIFTLNGIYLSININHLTIEKYYNKFKCSFDTNLYKDLIDKLQTIENNIIKKINIRGKIPQYKIYEQLKNGNIKIFSEDISKINNTFLLKIAGIWETDMYYGLTYKFIKL
jgi:Zn-dependent M16 (insulinase) family peptidase